MRRFATFLLVICLALNLPAAALAQAAGNNPRASGKGIAYAEFGPVPLEELILSRGSAAQINALDGNGNVPLKKGNYVRYIDRVEIPDYAMTLYKTMEEGSDGDGTADVLIDPTDASRDHNGNYVLQVSKKTVTIPANKAPDSILYDDFVEIATYAYAAVSAFDRDHPEVFWLNNNWSIASFVTNNGNLYTLEVSLILKGTVNHSSYDIRVPDYADPAVLKSAIAARDANVQAILDAVPATAITADEKMRYFNEWLTHNNQYNTAVSAGNSDAAWEMAWECISALQGCTGANGPVCEGYARAFQLLCTRSGIPCVLVSGHTQDINTGTGNGHMWNYVQLENRWYGVDVTWNDPIGGKSGKVSGYERENYLFVGAKTVPVTGGKPFLSDHPVENYVFAGGVRFTNGPVLNDTAYVNTHTHTFGSPSFRWEADHKSATAVFTCTGDPTHVMELPATVTAAVRTKATCEHTGTTAYTATVKYNGSNYTSIKDVKDIPALGHDWGEWVETVAPTETETGEQIRTCRNDPRHTETRVIPELRHEHTLTLVPGKAPTATEPGHTAYYICDGCDLWFEDAAGTMEITDKDSVVILFPVGLIGDVDRNGTVDSIDYMQLKRHVLGTFDFDDEQKTVADINHDGLVDGIDYMQLKRYVLGTYVIT